MHVGRPWLGLLALVAIGQATGCAFPTPSQEYTCTKDEDCVAAGFTDRECSPSQYCVEKGSSQPDASSGSDAGPADTMIDADPVAVAKAMCMTMGYTLEPTTNGLYRKVTANATWTNASNDCKDDVTGATHLITLSTDAEVMFQRTLNGAWIGWVDQPNEGMWHVLTSEVPAINYQTYWAGSRPDGGTDENCAIWRNSNPQGIDDVDCPQTHPYICECDGLPQLP